MHGKSSGMAAVGMVAWALLAAGCQQRGGCPGGSCAAPPYSGNSPATAGGFGNSGSGIPSTASPIYSEPASGGSGSRTTPGYQAPLSQGSGSR